MTSDAQINKFLTKIDEKSKQLRSNDMTRGDQELLKNRRLDLIWGDLIVEKADSQDAQVSAWRKSRARRVYREIQDTNDHLFLAFVLVIPPTECVKKSFGDIMEYLIRLKNYEPYRINLSPATKMFFESTAAEKGLNSCPYYLRFMQALFPKRVYPLESGQPAKLSHLDAESIQSWNDQSPDNRSRKRQRTSTDEVYPPGVTDRAGSDGPDAVIRLLEAHPKSDEDARQTTTASPAVSITCSNTPPNEMESGPTEKHLVLENASLRGIAEVFDNYICAAISKVTVQNNENPYNAAVTMNFPPRGLVDCLMSLDVHQSKVGYLAMALFKVRVESVGQVRYVGLKDGVRLTPNPEITLKGVMDEAIIDVFGSEIHGAITTCRMREKELEEGNNVTQCVSMILTSRPSDGAIINLSLGLKGGFQIQNKLYT